MWKAAFTLFAVWSASGLASRSTSSTAPSPFLAPWPEEPSDASSRIAKPLLVHDALRRRQDNSCPPDSNSCSSLNGSPVCCASGTDCRLDDAGQVACCPQGARCTGSIGGASVSGNTGGFVVGVGSTSTTTTTSGLLVPASTTSTSTALISGQGLSTVGTGAPNGGFVGFLPLATPFPNQQVCSSAYSSCQSEFQRCTSLVGGSVNGLTITGAGVTIAGPGATPVPSAASICQSLSSAVCLNLQLSNCNTLANAAAPTPFPPLYGVGVGLLLGVAEQVLV